MTQVLGEVVPFDCLRMLAGDDQLNMTLLALNLSGHVNGVAKKHGEVSQAMFPGYPIDSITNGVHALTWSCDSLKRLYDHYIPAWRNDPLSLRYALNIPLDEIWEAHGSAKRDLLEYINLHSPRAFDPDVLPSVLPAGQPPTSGLTSFLPIRPGLPISPVQQARFNLCSPGKLTRRTCRERS